MSNSGSNMEEPKLSMSIKKRFKSIKHKLSKIQNIENLLRENKTVNDDQKELLAQKEKLLLLSEEYDNIYKLNDFNESTHDDDNNKYIASLIELYYIFITHQSVNQQHISNFLSYFIVKNQENKQSYVNRILNFLICYSKGEGEFIQNMSYQSLHDIFSKIESPPSTYSSLITPLFDCSRSDMATMATTSQDSRSIHSDQVEDTDNCSATTPTTNLCADMSAKSDQYENSSIITTIIDHNNSLSTKPDRDNVHKSHNIPPNPISQNILLSRPQTTNTGTISNQNNCPNNISSAPTNQNNRDKSNNSMNQVNDTRGDEEMAVIAPEKPKGPWNTDFSRELPPQMRNPTKISPSDTHYNQRNIKEKGSETVKSQNDAMNDNNNTVNQVNVGDNDTVVNNNGNNTNNNPYIQRSRRNNNRFRDNQYQNRERSNWKYNQSNTTQDNINNAINNGNQLNKDMPNGVSNTNISAPSDSHPSNMKNNQNFPRRTNFNRRGARRAGFGPRRHSPPSRKIDPHNYKWQFVGRGAPPKKNTTEPVN